MSRILVTGAAGGLGTALIPRLLKAGYAVRGTSRRPAPASTPAGVEWAQADVDTGENLADAVQGVEVVIHAASQSGKRNRAVDVDGTRKLLEACRQAGVKHFIYVSIVGIDRIDYPYYRHKLAAEHEVEQGEVAWSIQRLTQFHSLIDSALRATSRYPVMPAFPGDCQFQLLDTGDAADILINAVKLGPSGRLPDTGGPQVATLRDLTREWLAAQSLKKMVMGVPFPAGLVAGYRAGHNCVPSNPAGTITWSEWLQAKYSEPAPVRAG